ncbi:MAG: hypothetical protein AB1646_19195 [Thermodesulfobacteriota bacterium]
MSKVRELHDEAMRLAHLALIARRETNEQEAETLAAQACRLESEAAGLIPEEEASEPTRSILYRSSASLAYQAKDLVLARRLVAKGLSGYPPPQVERELKDLFEQVAFESDLRERQQFLDDKDLELTFRGKSVGSGIIQYAEFAKRMEALSKLLDRVTQRLLGFKYAGGRRRSKEQQPFTPVLSAARAGSYAVTLKLTAGKSAQTNLFVTPTDVIEDVVTGIELFNIGDDIGLRERIRDEAYYKHFWTQAREIAPDGERVSSVGFVTAGRQVNLTRQREQMPPRLEPEDRESVRGTIRLEGILDFATSLKRNREMIGLTTTDGTQRDVVVQEGLDDLVRSYFGLPVIVSGTVEGNTVLLSDVQGSED